MSRIGNRKIEVPQGVTVTVENNTITVTGPKGTLTTHSDRNITLTQEENVIIVSRANDAKKSREMHGTINANVTNMIKGVTQGFEKGLEIIGVGYRFTVKGRTLVINAGYSHPVEKEIPAGIEVVADSNTEITIKGIDKIVVGEFAANVRKVRLPEPYKGKGIRYKDEYIKRKEGKKAA